MSGKSLSAFIGKTDTNLGTDDLLVNFTESDLSDLEFDQSNGIDYLYNIEPQSQNLFYAGYFCESSPGDTDYSPNIFYNARYRIRSITIPFPSFTADFHSERRNILPKDVGYNQEVNINWYEDVYHSVRRYHLDWYNRWYNRRKDWFLVGSQGKFRKIAITAFHYVNGDSDSLIPVPVIEPLFCIIIGGLVPKSIPPLTFDYSSDKNDEPFAMSYYCGPIFWIYTTAVGRKIFYGNKGSKSIYSSNEKTSLTNIQEEYKWIDSHPNVHGASDSSRTSSESPEIPERLRLIRATSNISIDDCYL